MANGPTARITRLAELMERLSASGWELEKRPVVLARRFKLSDVETAWLTERLAHLNILK